MSNDERVLDLIERIKNRELFIKNNSKFHPQTNCILEIDGNKKNIQVLSAEELKYLACKINVLNGSSVEMFGEVLHFSGFGADEWLEDIKNKINHLSVQREKEELIKTKKRLEELLSKDKKIELELDKLEEILK